LLGLEDGSGSDEDAGGYEDALGAGREHGVELSKDAWPKATGRCGPRLHKRKSCGRSRHRIDSREFQGD
jgi:hypothetical protein